MQNTIAKLESVQCYVSTSPVIMYNGTLQHIYYGCSQLSNCYSLGDLFSQTKRPDFSRIHSAFDLLIPRNVQCFSHNYSHAFSMFNQ